MTSRHKKRSHAGNREHKRTVKNLKKRTFDFDQIIDHVKSGFQPTTDEELPGGGLFYCRYCCRHFSTDVILQEHNTGKVHKRMVKRVEKEAADTYTSKDADFYAGRMPESIMS